MQIGTLTSVFNETTNSYKYYWFLSILEAIREGNAKELSIEDLSIKMFSDVLYPMNYYLLSFGKSDGFRGIADFVSTFISLDYSIPSESFIDQIERGLRGNNKKEFIKKINSLSRWVPYRFLRPFFSSETRGLSDAKVNKAIVELSRTASMKNPAICPYYFMGNKIVMNQIWVDYFLENIGLMKAFCYWHLTKFIQKNNPNSPGITEKLFKPAQRKLGKYTDGWNKFLNLRPYSRCIYSGGIIGREFSLDHFIPWSFVAHDLNWNIVPICSSDNSSKGNSLPSLEKYLPQFSEIQHSYFQIIYTNDATNQTLEDYCLLFNLSLIDIFRLPKSDFIKKIIDTITPLEQIAANMGFSRYWTSSLCTS